MKGKEKIVMVKLSMISSETFSNNSVDMILVGDSLNMSFR